MTQPSIEERLAALEDIRAIEELKWRYLRACDRKQPEDVRACFTDDAVIDYEGFPLFTDADAFVDVFRKWGCVPNIVDMHHGLHPIISLNGDRATGAFDLYFFQIDTASGRQTQLAVNYDDEFVRKEGGWLISRTVSRRMSMLVGTVGPDGIMRVEVAGRSDAEGPVPPPR
ncbi:nuclear transport factor 2 family protein [Novosphingobium aquimarinum]|uniref:nuclear transport factor 2 family protein n=1 Tax=Novosphingobium aquimarinum TaxID=2682494 RepID=UPI0012EBAAB9|nr:nuclear transport factor 2 family protein [Novosphingobium aquimarinum]